MLRGALYSSDGRDLKISVERDEVLLKSDEILNFPRIIELEGDRLVLAYGKGRHNGVETRPVAVSEDLAGHGRIPLPASQWPITFRRRGSWVI